MSKISYILPTNRALTDSRQSLESILQLPAHDKEIIVCAPSSVMTESDKEYAALNKITLIDDDKCMGSVYAFDKAYKASDGDYVSCLIDDIAYPSNFLEMLDFMNGDFMSRKIFKVANIMWDGGPGLPLDGNDTKHNGVVWDINTSHPIDVKLCPYAIIPLPFLERRTIEEKLSGHIFHPDFRQSYCDHWLGFYICKNEKFEPYRWKCKSISYIDIPNNRPSTSNNNTGEVFKKLVESFADGTPYV